MQLTDKPSGRRRARRLRRIGVAMLLAVLPVGVYRYSGFERLLPTGVLIRLQAAIDPQVTANELARRFNTDVLSDEEKIRIFKAAFRTEWTLGGDAVLRHRLFIQTNIQAALNLIPLLQGTEIHEGEMQVRPLTLAEVFQGHSGDADCPRFIAFHRNANGRLIDSVAHMQTGYLSAQIHLIGAEGQACRFSITNTIGLMDTMTRGILPMTYQQTQIVEGCPDYEAARLLDPDDYNRAYEIPAPHEIVIELEPTGMDTMTPLLNPRSGMPVDLLNDGWGPGSGPR